MNKSGRNRSPRDPYGPRDELQHYRLPSDISFSEKLDCVEVVPLRAQPPSWREELKGARHSLILRAKEVSISIAQHSDQRSRYAEGTCNASRA